MYVEGDFNLELDAELGGSCGEIEGFLPSLKQESAECTQISALATLFCCGDGILCSAEILAVDTCQETNMCECNGIVETLTLAPTEAPVEVFIFENGLGNVEEFEDSTLELDICDLDDQATYDSLKTCCPACLAETTAMETCLSTGCSVEPVAPPTDAPVAPVAGPTAAPVEAPTGDLTSGGASHQAALLGLAALIGYAMF